MQNAAEAGSGNEYEILLGLVALGRVFKPDGGAVLRLAYCTNFNAHAYHYAIFGMLHAAEARI